MVDPGQSHVQDASDIGRRSTVRVLQVEVDRHIAISQCLTLGSVSCDVAREVDGELFPIAQTGLLLLTDLRGQLLVE